jgi:hypothetical protein
MATCLLLLLLPCCQGSGRWDLCAFPQLRPHLISGPLIRLILRYLHCVSPLGSLLPCIHPTWTLHCPLYLTISSTVPAALSRALIVLTEEFDLLCPRSFSVPTPWFPHFLMCKCFQFLTSDGI